MFDLGEKYYVTLIKTGFVKYIFKIITLFVRIKTSIYYKNKKANSSTTIFNTIYYHQVKLIIKSTGLE